MKSFLALALLLALVAADDGFNTCWTYNSTEEVLPASLHPPTEWYMCDAQCGGSQQSPINIDLESVHQTTSMLALTFSYTLGTFLVSNKGPYVSLKNPTPSNYVMTDGYGKTYYLDSVHIHYHKTSDFGSEHAIAGRYEVAEFHLVHFQASYANLSAAINSGRMGAVSVLAILFKEGTTTNSANTEFAKIVAVIPSVLYHSDNVTVPISLFDPRVLLTKGSDALDYLHYNGSLTTPGCNEVVSWFIIQKASAMSSAQLAVLRSLSHKRYNTTDLEITANARPVQALNGRNILAYPKLHALGVSIDSYSITVASAILGVSIVGIIATIVAFIIITLRGHMAP